MQPSQAHQAPAPLHVVPALERLLAHGRIDEALELLRAAQRERPRSRAIRKGVAMLESRLLRDELNVLGDLSRVPRLAVSADALGALAPPDLGLAVKVDGVATIGDLLDGPPQRFEVARRLVGLIARGIISVPDWQDAMPTIIIEEPTMPERRRPPRPIECDRTAQIAVVPEAAAMLARARSKRARARARRNGRGWIVACFCIWIAGAGAAAGYHYQDIVWKSLQSALARVAGNR